MIVPDLTSREQAKPISLTSSCFHPLPQRFRTWFMVQMTCSSRLIYSHDQLHAITSFFQPLQNSSRANLSLTTCKRCIPLSNPQTLILACCQPSPLKRAVRPSAVPSFDASCLINKLGNFSMSFVFCPSSTSTNRERSNKHCASCVLVTSLDMS